MSFRALAGIAPLLLFGSCGGGGGGGGGGPTSLAYVSPTALYRQGVLATPDAPIVGGPAATAFAVTPTLPAGLVLDPVTGVLSGTPTAPAFLATYTVTASNAAGQAQGSLAIQVTPPLPATFATLEPGFWLGAATLLLVILALFIPVSMAVWFAPALVALDGIDPLTALKWSFFACLKNIWSFLVYGLVMLGLAIVATIPMGLGWLLLGPVIMASVYTAYRDIFFVEPEAPPI